MCGCIANSTTFHGITMQPFTLTLNLPTLGAIAAAAWFFWMRFQNLEQRLRKIETEDLKLHSTLERSRSAAVSDREMLEYRVNENTNLINHRTQRFTEALEKLETRMLQEIFELKGFLERTTEFVPRNRIDG
jgi:hypothetical protein